MVSNRLCWKLYGLVVDCGTPRSMVHVSISKRRLYWSYGIADPR